MSSKKVWILLPDGIGLRNFIYTDFLENEEVVVWTPLEYVNTDHSVIRLPEFKDSRITEFYKNTIILSNLKTYSRNTNNQVYMEYVKKISNPSIRQSIRMVAMNILSELNPFFIDLRKYYLSQVRKSTYYQKCKKQLAEDRPKFLFCTHQRISNAVAPVLAAKDLGIPTGTFIFSWDNMPKGNLTVPAEHLFVWSEYMKKEAIEYFPYIEKTNIHVVGTPQFIPYTNEKLIEKREEFCRKYGLDPLAKIICFSGDDILTSPYDHIYLEDVAKAVRWLNKTQKQKFEILFRRCPVDLSDRYDDIINKYADVIKPVPPLWKSLQKNSLWNEVVPSPEDMKLLVNTVFHSVTAVNIGSTIAHDFACMGKTSCYLNYNTIENAEWNIHKIYTFIHFQSKKNLDPIYWINDRQPDQMAKVLIKAINDTDAKIQDSKKWLQRITLHPLNEANKRIWSKIHHLSSTKDI